jgi:hypothetical protein
MFPFSSAKKNSPTVLGTKVKDSYSGFFSWSFYFEPLVSSISLTALKREEVTSVVHIPCSSF